MKAFTSLKSIIWILALGLILTFGAALAAGRISISGSEMLTLIMGRLQGNGIPEELISKELVFYWIRLPRCIMAVLVGVGLSLSGAVYQGLFRNPLVSPDILGVSAGCTFGAALGLIMGASSLLPVHMLSFAFGILAVALSVGLARVIAVKPVIVLVLAGMVVLSFFNALLMTLKYFSDPYDELPSIIFWVMGSLGRVTWGNIGVMAPITLGGILIFRILSFRLNILSLGDTQAKSLGINPQWSRTLLITVSSFLVASAVATCGQICWIGLIIPHMARSLVGPGHEKMMPVTALLGGIFLLTADAAARSFSSAEIPVGIITALTGAPIFGYLMFKNRGSGWI
ncbi:MAG: iron ABC transporter permease [Desulfobacterales bacterium]|nr:iron ABC transporter permease [Desulfobacterales bacterium]